MRRVFKDEAYEQRFNRDGYLRLECLDAATIARIEEFYLANSDQNFTGFHNSLSLQAPETKAKIHKFLAQIFDEYLRDYFDDYRALVATFVSKKSDPGSVVAPHQDWWLVNEREYTSLNVWAPLCATNAENGALGLFKGSHRLKQNITGTNLDSNLFIPAELLKYLTFFHMKAGEVLFYSTQIIHASAPNKSGRQRTAASIGVIPSETRPLHYVGKTPGASKILELEVDEEFYHRYYMNKSRHVSPSDDHVVNTGGYRSREVEYTPDRIDGQDILRLYEPRAVATLRRIKDRLKAKVVLR